MNIGSTIDPVQKIVCAGRLERFKGQDCLVKAFARIAAKHPSAQLVLIGPDQWSTQYSFQDLVNRTVSDESIRSRIILTGPLRLAQVQTALGEAAIAVICSSGFESFSFSTLEAMAHARPIIGSRVGAIPELLDNGQCGRLAAPGNAVDFAHHQDELLSDRQLCQTLATAAYQKARRCYHTDAVLPEFVKVFEDAMRGDEVK